MDYTCERGAKRNFEVWRNTDPDANKLETDEERLDRLEAERAEAGGVMEELEMKVHDAKREMEIADALDEIRTRNARIGRAEGREVDGEGGALEAAERVRREREAEKIRIEEEDAEAARKAFANAAGADIEVEVDDMLEDETPAAGPSKGATYGDLIAAQTADGVLPEESKRLEKAEGDMAPPPPPKPAAAKPIQTPAPAPEFKRVVKKKKDFSAALGIKKKPALV